MPLTPEYKKQQQRKLKRITRDFLDELLDMDCEGVVIGVSNDSLDCVPNMLHGSPVDILAVLSTLIISLHRGANLPLDTILRALCSAVKYKCKDDGEEDVYEEEEDDKIDLEKSAKEITKLALKKILKELEDED